MTVDHVQNRTESRLWDYISGGCLSFSLPLPICLILIASPPHLASFWLRHGLPDAGYQKFVCCSPFSLTLTCVRLPEVRLLLSIQPHFDLRQAARSSSAALHSASLWPASGRQKFVYSSPFSLIVTAARLAWRRPPEVHLLGRCLTRGQYQTPEKYKQRANITDGRNHI